MSELGLLLSYCARSWRIFPQRGKVPLIKGGHGFNGASADPAQITAWYEQYRGCQWAAATGAASGISVLDIDPAHGGEEELNRLLAQFEEPFPNTLTARSGGGGTHFYFQAVPGLRSSAGRVGDGLDVKSEGGSITLAPSVHKSGQRYRWLNDVDLAPFPKWLRGLAERNPTRAEEREADKRAEEARGRFSRTGLDERTKAYAEAALDGAIGAVKEAGEGKRRDTLNAEAYSLAQLVGAGILERDLIADSLTAAGLAAGLSSREVAATVKAAMIDGIRAPRAPRFEDRQPPRGRTYTNGHDMRTDAAPPVSEEEYEAPASAEGGPPVTDPGPHLELLDIRPLSEPLPARQWILGRTYCRGFLHGLIGAGSAGKTAMRITQLLAVASGKPLSGEEVHTAGKVLLLCFEDDHNEIERRIRAAMVHHQLDEEDVAGLLRFAIVKGMWLAESRNDGRAVPGALYRELDALIAAEQPVVATIDPLAGAHLLDENDNAQMVALAQMLGDLAIKHNFAMDFIHHTRKGNGDAGDVERSRGASALTNHCRIVQVLSTMSIEEARQLGLADKERRGYVRLDDGKTNIAPASEEARWFKLSSVRLPNGDSVQAMSAWEPEALFENVAPADARAALVEIGRGASSGVLYSAQFGRETAAWRVVYRIFPDRTDKQCQAMVERWINNGALERAPFKDPETRKQRMGLKLNPLHLPSMVPALGGEESAVEVL